MNQDTPDVPSTHSAGLGRRFGAIFYDLLLLVAVLMVAATPVVLAIGGPLANFWYRLLFQVYLLTVIFLYYASFWIYGGQTLGLRTWQLRAVAADGGPVTWFLALKRFAAALISTACAGLGFFWALVDREKLTWHDRLSGTRLVLVKLAPPLLEK